MKPRTQEEISYYNIFRVKGILPNLEKWKGMEVYVHNKTFIVLFTFSIQSCSMGKINEISTVRPHNSLPVHKRDSTDQCHDCQETNLPQETVYIIKPLCNKVICNRLHIIGEAKIFQGIQKQMRIVIKSSYGNLEAHRSQFTCFNFSSQSL